MDTFVCSSWYHFRYPSPHDDTAAFDREAVELLAAGRPLRRRRRARRHAPALRAVLLQGAAATPAASSFGEPYATLRNQGLILAEDGQKMSKSKGNVVTPDSVVERYGADSLRLYELFIAPFEQAVAWNDRGVQGCLRFLTRFWGFALGVAGLDGEPVERRRRSAMDAGGRPSGRRRRRRRTGRAAASCAPLHKTVRKVTGDMRGLPLQHRGGRADGGRRTRCSRCGPIAAASSTPPSGATSPRPSRCCSRP